MCIYTRHENFQDKLGSISKFNTVVVLMRFYFFHVLYIAGQNVNVSLLLYLAAVDRAQRMPPAII